MTNLSFTLSDQSYLFNTLQRCHYIDRFQAPVTDRNESIQITSAVQAFFTTTPGWLRRLVAVLNSISGLLERKPLQQKSAQQAKMLQTEDARVIRRLPMQLYHQTENEIVLGEDNRNLSLRISFFLEQQHSYPHRNILTVTTMVQFNNILGRLYFFPVRYLHQLLIPLLLQNAVLKMEEN